MTLIPEIVDMDMPVEGVFHNLVIAKIKKDYAGQGQKVMNAMWGAGQMMFNKILVLVDGDVKIQNYEELAKYILTHKNRLIFIFRGRWMCWTIVAASWDLEKMYIDGTSSLKKKR
jgi:4-hydroxy-3-polyprenylbenzoate decarboxylase